MGRTFKHRTVDEVVWTPGTEVTGIIHEFETIDTGKDKRDSVVIDTGTQLIRVWHAEGLKEVFDEGEVGDGIRVEFVKKVPLKGGHTFNKYAVALWTEVPDEPTPTKAGT